MNDAGNGTISCPKDSYSSGATDQCIPCEDGEHASVASSQCSICSPGQYYDVSSETCTQCSEGKFEPSGRETSCETCDISDGFVSPGAGNAQCLFCVAGKRADAASHSCVTCPAGRFSPGGTNVCSACNDEVPNTGKFSGEGAASCSIAVAGTKANSDRTGYDVCGPNTFSTGATDSCTSCTAGDHSQAGASSCLSCSPGHIFEADTFSCVQCEIGKVAENGRLEVCETCDQSSGFVAPTTGMSNCLYCGTGKVAQSNDCVNCVPSKYSLGGTDACTDCAPNSYSSGTNSSSCSLCDPGRVPNESRTGCVNCEAGKRSVVGDPTCTMCGAGEYSDETSSVCSICSPGRFSTSGSPTCDACVGGKYSSNGAETCVDCDAGSKSSDEAGTCTSCTAGRFSSASSATCSGCAGGRYSTIGSSSCSDCDAGYHSSAESGSCSSCSAGRYSSAGSSECLVCAGGKYSQASSTFCSICDAGYHSSAEAGICAACGSGKFSPAGSATCIDCIAGKKSGQAVQSCSNCTAGRYSPAAADSCNVCPAGKVSEEASASCHGNCPAGRWSSSGSSECQDCEPGKFSFAEAASCSRCLAGKYSGVAAGVCNDCAVSTVSASGASSCETCNVSAGLVAPTTGLSVCEYCGPGLKADSISNRCTLCVPGRYSLGGEDKCLQCESGTVSTDFGSVACNVCPPGSSNNDAGTGCNSCPAGRYAVGEECSLCKSRFISGEGQSYCQVCLAGTVNNTQHTECKKCVAGKYSGTADGHCTDCESGKYEDREGSSECKLCSEAVTGSMTEEAGASSTKHCICKEKTFLDLYDADWCQPVRKGVDRVNYGLELQSLPLDPGYWRTTPNSTNVEACRTEEACVGGNDTLTYCLYGHKGPFCEVCFDGFSKDVFGICQPCNVSTENVLWTAGTMAGALVFLTCLHRIYSYCMKRSKRREEQIKSIKVAARIIFVCYQILGVLPSIIPNLELPKIFEKFLDLLQFFQLNLFQLVSAGCFWANYDYHNTLFLMTVVPLGIAILLWTFGKANKDWRDDSFTIALAITFVVLPSVSTMTFGAFPCVELDTGEELMISDYSIDCTSFQYNAGRVYAGVMLLVYPIGIPSLYTYLLFTKKDLITQDVFTRDQEDSLVGLEFLYYSYKPQYWWFEIFTTIMRLALTGILGLIQPGTATQLCVGMLMTLIGIIVSCCTMPYIHSRDNTLGILSFVQIFLVLMAALVLKTRVAQDNEYDEKYLGVLLICVNLMIIVVAFVW